MTVIAGDNATGKTTIIESLALLATGESFRVEKIEEIIQFAADLGRIKAVFADGLDSETGSDEVEVIITPGQVQGKTMAKRLFSVNGVRRRKKDAVGKFYAVVFRPEDMRLIEGSPGRRRQFFDIALSALHPEYSHALSQYESNLKRRNKLLSQIKDGEQSVTTLLYWSAAILKHGQVLQEHRQQFLQTFVQVPFDLDFTVGYLPSLISEDRLNTYRDREIAAGHSLIGPHKDDFEVQLLMQAERRNIALYGSRGQQRLGVLWLKLCELGYARQTLSQDPVLLLDDILSELDDEHQRLALKTASEQQTIVTTADVEVEKILRKRFADAYHYQLSINQKNNQIVLQKK
jgi:DNA replication and repair protein RecF